jgi:Xaa-Pro aminopeptidase
MTARPRTPPVDPQMSALFAEHRRRALEAMAPGSAMLLFAAPHYLRNADTEYPYRQRSDVFYLTGWRDPEVAVLLRPGAEHPFVLFVQPRDPEREVWTGWRPGPEGAVELFGADAAHPFEELDERLPELLMGCESLYYEAMVDPESDERVRRALTRARRPARVKHLPLPAAFLDPGLVLHELRLFKSEAELAILREAARITAEAHSAAMGVTRPGAHEYELEAEINYTFRRLGGEGPGYGTIVGAGPNACVLHYVANRDALEEGDLVLVDAGCEYKLYTADVTRTWPASGRFTEPQRQVYQVVLDAQLAAIAAARAGNTFTDVHDAAVRGLVEGMVAIGLMEGEVDAIIEEKTYRRYYMHNTSHWLGLDVHDVGAYSADGGSRPLAPGMVLTIEPGLYIDPDDEQAPERFRGIGVRIEDDVLVTDGAPDVLTAAVPKTVAEIEATVGSTSLG